MGLFYIALPTLTGVLLMLISALFLWQSVRHIPWKKLQEPTVFSAWCASIIVIVLLWRMRVPVYPDLHLHLLGAALFALMFGRHLAAIGLAVAVFAFTAEYDGIWMNTGVNILLLAVLPCWLSDFILQKVRHHLPQHMFVYLFGNGFFGALIVNGTTGALAITAHLLLLPVQNIPDDAYAYMLLLAWGEAFLVGFLVTIFAVYRPAWLFTFDDDIYLKEK